MSKSRMTAILRLIAILESAHERKQMYFNPVEPKMAEHWLSGLQRGCSLAGLDWSPEHRLPALERRGLEPSSFWETKQLEQRGLGPEEIVNELLAIEIEMWRHAGGLED